MSIEQKVKLVLGEQHIQIITLAETLEQAQAKIKELEAKLKALTEKEEAPPAS